MQYLSDRHVCTLICFLSWLVNSLRLGPVTFFTKLIILQVLHYTLTSNWNASEIFLVRRSDFTFLCDWPCLFPLLCFSIFYNPLFPFCSTPFHGTAFLLLTHILILNYFFSLRQMLFLAFSCSLHEDLCGELKH